MYSDPGQYFQVQIKKTFAIVLNAKYDIYCNLGAIPDTTKYNTQIVGSILHFFRRLTLQIFFMLAKTSHIETKI